MALSLAVRITQVLLNSPEPLTAEDIIKELPKEDPASIRRVLRSHETRGFIVARYGLADEDDSRRVVKNAQEAEAQRAVDSPLPSGSRSERWGPRMKAGWEHIEQFMEEAEKDGDPWQLVIDVVAYAAEKVDNDLQHSTLGNMVRTKIKEGYFETQGNHRTRKVRRVERYDG